MKEITYRIERNDYPESPREWDNVGTLATPGWVFDEHNCKWQALMSGLDILWDLFYFATEYGWKFYDDLKDAFYDEDQAAIERVWRETGRHYVMLALHIHEERGRIDISTDPAPGERFDGLIFCTRERAISGWGKKRISPRIREKALSCMEGEVSTLEAWCNGEVYGYIVEVGGEHEDSCWGFYSEEEAREQARSVVERVRSEMQEQSARDVLVLSGGFWRAKEGNSWGIGGGAAVYAAGVDLEDAVRALEQKIEDGESLLAVYRSRLSAVRHTLAHLEVA